MQSGCVGSLATLKYSSGNPKAIAKHDTRGMSKARHQAGTEFLDVHQVMASLTHSIRNLCTFRHEGGGFGAEFWYVLIARPLRGPLKPQRLLLVIGTSARAQLGLTKVDKLCVSEKKKTRASQMLVNFLLTLYSHPLLVLVS